MSLHVSDRLSAYLDGELSVVDAGGVRQHLASCEACAAALRELVAVDRAVRELPVTAPDGYFDTFSSRVRTRVLSSGRARGGRGLPRWTWALAAALLLAMVLPRMPWDRNPPAARPAAQAPAASLPSSDKDRGAESDSFAQARPPAAPATLGPAAGAGPAERDALLRQEPGRLDEKRSNVAVDEPKADAVTPGKARRQYAEPPPEAAAFSTAEARVAAEGQSSPPAPAPTPALAQATADAARAPRASSARAPGAAAPYTGAAAAEAKDTETEKLRADSGLLDEAAGGEGASTSEPAKEQLEKKGERPAQPRAAIAGGRGTPGSLDTRVATSLEQRRALREEWRKFAREHAEDARADDGRVRVVALGMEIAKETGKAADLAQVRADAAAYLVRTDARQKERVKAMLAALDR